MVKQGDIIKVDFNPQKGHEQGGYRPALVISNSFFNNITKLAIICPISSANKPFPLHLPLDSRTLTQGYVLCQHPKTVDLSSRAFKFVERAPEDITSQVVDMVFSEIEIK